MKNRIFYQLFQSDVKDKILLGFWGVGNSQAVANIKVEGKSNERISEKVMCKKQYGKTYC